MFGTLQHSHGTPARSLGRRPEARPHTLPVTQAHSGQRVDPSPRGTDAALSRRRFLGLSAPLAVLLGGLPAGMQVAWPAPANAAAVPQLPSPAVKAILDKAFLKAIPKGKAAVTLRLVFHDAGTFTGEGSRGGLNASIQYELDRPENFGLKRGWRVIEQVREDIRGTPADAAVTDADLIALAGAYAVRLCGGPDVPVPVGRPVAAAGSPDPPGAMPTETFGADEIKRNFAAKGLSVQEMVVLSGAHTLGGKGFGDPVRFDNEYFLSLLRRPWLKKDDPMAAHIGIPSDHVLPEDPECLPYIQRYADDQAAFFRDFAAAYVKMASLGVPGWA